MRFCTHCGQPMAEQVPHCPRCGVQAWHVPPAVHQQAVPAVHQQAVPAAHQQAVPVAHQQAVPVAHQQAVPVRAKPRFGLAGCVAVVLVLGFLGLVGGVGAWYFLQGRLTAKVIGAVDGAQQVAATLGALDEDGVRVDLPPKTFSQQGKVTLKTAGTSRSSGVDSSRFELLAAPFAIHLEGRDHVRTEEPVTVSFKLPARELGGLEDRDAVRFAYRYKGEWRLQRMDHVDLTRGVATVTLHHFSEIAPAAAKKKEIRSEVAQDLATRKWEQEHNRKATKKAVEGPLEELIVKMTGVKDPSVIKAIVEEAANTTSVTTVMKAGAQAYLDGRDKTAAEAELATKLAEISINYLARKSGNLEADFGNETGLGAAMVQGGTLGKVDPKEAAKVLAKAVIGTTGLGKLFISAARITEVSVAAFKNNGIEEMYEAYRDGANGLYGFSVDPGDFDALLSQSPAVVRQVRIDAVGEYCRVHAVEESTLSKRQIEDIQRRAVERLELSFESRRAQEAEIAQSKRVFERLLQAFESGELDSTAMRRDSFSNLTYEQRLHRFYRISQSILDLTGKTVNHSGESYDKFISDHDLVEAMRKWLSSKEEAMEFLREKGLLPDEAGIAPIPMSASGVIRYGTGAKAVLRVSIRFTNVGSQVPGQGAVTGSATDAADGEVYPIQGTFTGGPNGTMTVTANEDTYHAHVSGGRQIVVKDVGTLTIDNPAGFEGLPR